MGTHTFEIETVVAAAPDQVWRHATDMHMLNLELRPLIRMTYPKQHQDLTKAVKPSGNRLFRSRIYLFGFLPIDFYDVTFMEFEPGRRFLERSPTLLHDQWQHERVIEPVTSGSRVRDRVVFSPRVAWLGQLDRRIVCIIFTMRHKNLRKLFGDASLDLAKTNRAQADSVPGTIETL